METLVDFLESFIGDMRINLRRRNRSMPKHSLDRPDIGPVHEEVGRKAMAESMRMDILHDPYLFGVVLDQTFNTPWSKPLAFSPSALFVNQPLLSVRDKEGWVNICPMVEVVRKSHFGRR